MTTRTALVAEIIDDMERDATADGPRVLAAISSAIKFYQPKRFYFNESRDVTFSTVASTSSYAFPSVITTEFYRIDSAVVTESGNNHFLDPRDYRDLEILIDSNANEGRPWSYTYINRAIRLYPVPDAVYTVRLTGHVKLAEPATDGETDNPWMTDGYELIRSRAKWSIYTHVYPDPSMAAAMNGAEGDALKALKSATVDRVGTGQIVPTQF